MAGFANQIRKLIELAVTCDLPPDEIAAFTEVVSGLRSRMMPYIPSPRYPRFVLIEGGDEIEDLADSMPYDLVIGRFNPLAPPLTMWKQDKTARAKGVFSPAYEGGPSWVHGAALAGAFDIVLTAANRLADAAGPTMELHLTFRRPTLVEVDCYFEAWVEERLAHRVVSRGRLTQQGVVTVEATGRFAVGRQGPPELPQ